MALETVAEQRVRRMMSEQEWATLPPKPVSAQCTSDGGSSGYYDFPDGCNTLNDLIEYRGMSFAEGNIFKATYRLGRKQGAPTPYDLKKIIYYATRMLNEQQGVPYGKRDNPTS